MPNWGDVLGEITDQRSLGQGHADNSVNLVRHKYLGLLQQKTGRNIIAYYSGWLSKPMVGGVEINDEDKNGFMMAVHKLDKSLGLDLLIHTPGGSIASTQSIVDYLHKVFNRDIRAFVPQIAMSAGTMIACSCREIWMGKHSNLGPIDPQVNAIPAYGVLSEFQRACREIKKDPSKTDIWAQIISQYRPTFLTRCQNAIDWSNAFVEDQLIGVMFKGDPAAKAKAKKIVKKLSHYPTNRTHELHIHSEECKKMGLNIKLLEEDGDQNLQDLVLTVHHCYMHLFMNTATYKAIENHNGVALLKRAARDN